MALSATTVQAQTTNTCKKTPTAKAKICTVGKKMEGDFRCDEAKVKKTAHRAGCAMKCDAKKACKAVKCDGAKMEKAAKKTCCKTKNVCQTYLLVKSDQSSMPRRTSTMPAARWMIGKY